MTVSGHLRDASTGCLLLLGALLASGCTGSHRAGPGDDGGDIWWDGGAPRGWDAGSGGTPGWDGGSLRRDAGPIGDRAGDVWEGYIEAYVFFSGSDRVRIVFDSATGDGPRTGIVVFGAGVPPPPATDPDIGYPPDVDWGSRGFAGEAWEGYEYPIADGSVDGARVRLRVPLGELWTDWCELQTSYPQDPSGTSYGCIPNTGGGTGPGGCYYNDPATGAPVAIDCAKFALCDLGSVCRCDATGCTGGEAGSVSFDFHVMGDNGDGSVEIGGLRNVHLTR